MYSNGDLNVMDGSLLILIGAIWASASPAVAASDSWKRSSSILRLTCAPRCDQIKHHRIKEVKKIRVRSKYAKFSCILNLRGLTALEDMVSVEETHAVLRIARRNTFACARRLRGVSVDRTAASPSLSGGVFLDLAIPHSDKPLLSAMCSCYYVPSTFRLRYCMCSLVFKAPPVQ